MMALFLNAAKTLDSALARSEVSDLLQSIGRQIEVHVSDYRVFISASPSTIAFTSMWGSLGLPSAVTAFIRVMERHGIIVVTVSALATEGHRYGGESTWG